MPSLPIWTPDVAGAGVYMTIPFVIAVMGTSGTLLYDTMRGVSIRHKSIGYYFVVISTSFVIGLVMMLVTKAVLPGLFAV